MDVMYHDLPMKLWPSKYNDDVDYVIEYMYFTLNLFSSTFWYAWCFFVFTK